MLLVQGSNCPKGVEISIAKNHILEVTPAIQKGYEATVGARCDCAGPQKVIPISKTAVGSVQPALNS
jgi:hypothetical protein